jgi:hypothetical protein
LHHNKKDVKFADLTDRELDKLVEAEKFINSQPDHAGRNEEIILLAYKKGKS